MSNEIKEEEDASYELGDRILITGGRYDNLKGRIYYIDPELIRVLPEGVSDRLVDLPIVQTEDEGYDIDPELGIEHLYLLSKRANPAFVAQIGAQVGERAETFGANGEPGPNFTIKAIDEKEDKITLEDETGAEEEILFEFRGIPQDEPFAVLRPRQNLVSDRPALIDGDDNEGPVLTEENFEGENAESAPNEFAEFEDVMDDEMQQSGNSANSGLGGIYEIPSTQRVYPDSVQRGEMLQDFIDNLDPASQKSEEAKKEIRKLVEQCMLLRNNLVQYSSAGDPVGINQLSYLTLSEIINGIKIPLSRPVIDANRTLYLDHSTDHYILRQSNDPTYIPGLKVNIKYIDDVIPETIQYMNTQLGGIQKIALSSDDLPKWFQSWEVLNKQYGDSWTSASSDNVKSFREDTEFFRAPFTDPNTHQVDGLDVLGEDMPATAGQVKKIPYSLLRGLGPRHTRLSPKEAPRRIESAEEGSVVNTMLFPLSEQRFFGSVRSGSLTKDIALSQQPGQTFGEILARLDGIPDVATTGSIICVGPGGNTQGNITLEDWMRALPIYPLGIADARLELANYGLGQVEFNADQQEVIIEKIQTYRALVKQYITEIREAANKTISQLVSEPNPFLTGEAAAELLDTLDAEPLLKERIKELRAAIPIYRENDIATVAGIMLKSEDLFLKVLAQVPGPLARERNSKVRDQFLEALHNAMRKGLLQLMSGDIPTPNDCAHVEDYNKLLTATNDSQRMRLLAKFLTRFQSSQREDNWVKCNTCSKHLICYHEVLLMNEFLHPREKDTIHKELLLGFSGTQFQGKFICKNCGQKISDMEFDNAEAKSDNGTPLLGRAVLDTAEQDENEQLMDIFSPPAGDVQEIEFKTDQQTTIYRVARKIFDMVGIYADQATYQRIVQRVDSALSKQPSRKKYAQETKGQKATDYDILINRLLVTATGANCLIEVQTNIPGYVIRYKMPGCRAGFSGFPMGNEKDRTGVEYIACAIAGINENASPWNLTGFLQISNDKKRQDAVADTVFKMVVSLVGHAEVQQQMSLKRTHLKELFGNEVFSEQLPERIPPRFTPVPYNIADEETAKNAIVPQAATVAQVVRAWVLQAHRFSKENGIYIKGNPYSEATCCLKPIQEPGAFWREKAGEMATLPLKQPPLGPTKSHLSVHFKPRPLSRLEGEISPELIYRIFLKLCYTGPNMGLLHQPGYTNECIHCGFEFPESPYAVKLSPPMASDKGTQKELMKAYEEEVSTNITNGKVALETQNIPISETAFEELIDATHRAFRVEMAKPEAPLAGMKLLETFRRLEPEPFQGWRDIVTQTMGELGKLTPNPSEIEIAEAYGPISNTATQIFEEFARRVGVPAATALKNIVEASPAQSVESISTYFLVPFQRAACGFNLKSVTFVDVGSLRKKTNSDISVETRDDVNSFLETHFKFVGDLNQRAAGLTVAKLKWAVGRLSDSLKMLKTTIRGSYIPGGNTGLRYFTSALIGGILEEFINPNMTPPDLDDDYESTDTRAPIHIFDICVKKLVQEGLNFSEETIRDMINKRNEKEKNLFISRFDNLTEEGKASMKMMKKLGLGEWSVGGTKAIYAYDPNQAGVERRQRAEMGLEGTGGGAEEGYATAQIAEDDY